MAPGQIEAGEPQYLGFSRRLLAVTERHVAALYPSGASGLKQVERWLGPVVEHQQVPFNVEGTDIGISSTRGDCLIGEGLLQRLDCECTVILPAFCPGGFNLLYQFQSRLHGCPLSINLQLTDTPLRKVKSSGQSLP